MAAGLSVRAALLAVTLTIATPAAAEGVALTFDDLPVFGPVRSVAEQTAITRKLLRGLVRQFTLASGSWGTLVCMPWSLTPVSRRA